MDRPALPAPVTRSDRYFHDIAASLRTLVDRGDVPELPDGEVRLEEPATYVCETCGKAAKSAAGLAAHRRSHDA